MRNGLDGNACVVKLNFDEKINRNLVCMRCGKPINQKEQGRTRKFCSEKCRRVWWNENQQARNKSEDATYNYVCPYCGREFGAYGNKKRKYCSHNCYIRDRFWREEDERAD
jgi:endogenous inhibitor of DNA gyrase (YacG/DUF329 family)